MSRRGSRIHQFWPNDMYALYRRYRYSIHCGDYIYVTNDVKSLELLNIDEDERGFE